VKGMSKKRIDSDSPGEARGVTVGSARVYTGGKGGYFL